jgi:hypothetical protein
MSATPVQIALDLARAGFPVFPCRYELPLTEEGPKDKSPHTPHGFKDASTDPDQIAAWWRKHTRALVGMPTGKASGFFVVDLDTDKATGEAVGEATLAAFGLSHLLSGPRVDTPSGGRHLYFRADGLAEGLGCTQSKIGPAIDTRGEGGYVIAPGSVAPAGAYVSRNAPLMPHALPPLPEALRRALEGKPKAEGFHFDTGAGQGWGAQRAEVAEVQEVLDYIPPDCGYGEWLYVLMGLHDHFGGSQLGLSIADTWSAKGRKYRPGEVAAKWATFVTGGAANWAKVCSVARQNGADLKAIARRHRGRNGGGHDDRDRNDWESASRTSGAAGDTGGRTSDHAHGAGGGPQEPPERPLPTPFQWRDPATLPPRPWLYGRHLLRGQVSVTVAPGGVGKSAHSIVEALAMVSGRELLDEWTAKGLKVWVFNLEDPRDELDRRIAAAMLHHDVTPAKLRAACSTIAGASVPCALPSKAGMGSGLFTRSLTIWPRKSRRAELTW